MFLENMLSKNTQENININSRKKLTISLKGKNRHADLKH